MATPIRRQGETLTAVENEKGDGFLREPLSKH